MSKVINRLWQPVPADGETVVMPNEDILLVEEGEKELASQGVVITDSWARDRKAEDAVQENGIGNVVGKRKFFSGELGCFTKTPKIDSKFLEAVHPERGTLTDHEGVKGEFSHAMGLVVDQIPEREGVLNHGKRVEPSFELGVEPKLSDLRGLEGIPLEPA